MVFHGEDITLNMLSAQNIVVIYRMISLMLGLTQLSLPKKGSSGRPVI